MRIKLIFEGICTKNFFGSFFFHQISIEMKDCDCHRRDWMNVIVNWNQYKKEWKWTFSFVRFFFIFLYSWRVYFVLCQISFFLLIREIYILTFYIRQYARFDVYPASILYHSFRHDRCEPNSQNHSLSSRRTWNSLEFLFSSFFSVFIAIIVIDKRHRKREGERGTVKRKKKRW